MIKKIVVVFFPSAGANTSRSYVVSQATSEAQHVVPHSVPGIPGDNNRSVQSNYESPQVTGRRTSKTKRKNIGRTSQASTDRSYGARASYKETQTVVPPLNLTGRHSPPIPTLRNKMTEKYEITSPKSCSTVSPAATKSHLHRTVSSHSEPCDGSLALSSSKIGTKESDVGGIVTQFDKSLSDSRVTKNDEEFDLPFYTLEDAFMIPFHRTDSATLPAPSETPEPNPSQGVTKISPRVKKGKEVLSTQRYPMNAAQNSGNSITAIYRTASSHLKPDRAEPDSSPRRTKGNKSIQVRHQSQSTKSIPSYKSGSRMESDHKLLNKNTNTQQRLGKRAEKKALKDHGTARSDATSVLSTHQVSSKWFIMNILLCSFDANFILDEDCKYCLILWL